MPKWNRQRAKLLKQPTSVRVAVIYSHDPTKSEARFAKTLKSLEREGFKFKRSWAIGPYIADFYCHDHKLILELDGYIHRQSRQRVHDSRRDEYFKPQGIKTIRISSQIALLEPGATLKALRNHLGLDKKPAPEAAVWSPQELPDVPW